MEKDSAANIYYNDWTSSLGDIRWVPVDNFTIKSGNGYPEEPTRYKVIIDGFWKDNYPADLPSFNISFPYGLKKKNSTCCIFENAG